ncbi:MAG: hypothetical protein QOJ90_2829 [Actinomycetota bacterium]|jgi:hypothetical protein|nr:hypothetical protein [Actinomycetota bacterium]
MTSLGFEVLDVRAQEHAASPHLLFRLRVEETEGEVVHALALRAQLRIEPQRRGYDPAEQEGLTDLFGTPDRYGATLKPFLWTHATAMVQGFQGSREFDLPVACTYDFEVSASKYLHALREGDIPLVLLFSGTVFTRGATGFSVEQLSWSLEARCRLPVSAWRRLMDLYFPGGGWIRLDRDTIDALGRHKSARGLTSWEAAITDLLPAEVPSR